MQIYHVEHYDGGELYGYGHIDCVQSEGHRRPFVLTQPIAAASVLLTGKSYLSFERLVKRPVVC